MLRLFRTAAHRAFAVSLLLGAFGLITASAYAQSRHEGNYTIELVVFSQPQGATQEQFPQHLRLRYPNRLEQLSDPVDAAAANGPDAKAPQTAATHNASNIQDTANAAYQRQPASAKTLASEARKLNQSGYKVLFHEVWQQPVTSARSARNLAIHGGDTYGEHYELEGSIAISVATYLKLTTNLWLTEFIPSGNLTGDVAHIGIELPPRPTPPKTLEQLQEEASLDRLFDTVESATEATPPVVADATPTYLAKQVVLMQQSRDLRSEEIHYLDHPKLGIMVKITPLERTE